MISALVTAVRTLTIIPVPGKDCNDYNGSLFFFPFIGAVLGVFSYGIARAFYSCSSEYSLLGGFAVTAFVTILTGALHIDGLADVTDGLLGGRTRERALEIMKDPRHGTYGVIALIFSVTARTLIYSIIISQRFPWYMWNGAVVSRALMAISCSALPYARADGKAHVFFKSNPFVIVSMAALLVSGIIFFTVSGHYPISGAIIAASLSAFVTVWYCFKKLQGITGDCLGAVNEVAEIAFLFSGVVFLHILQYY